MRRKIRQCNRASHPQALGWKRAAKIYWSMIAEAYEIVQGLLDRLELLLGGTEPSEDGPKVKLGTGTVKFSKVVKGRWILEEGGADKEFTLHSTNDRKRSAGRMKARKNVQGGNVLERGKSEQDIWLQVAGECGDVSID